MTGTTDQDPAAAARFLTTPDGKRHELPTKGSVTLGSAPAESGVIHLDGPEIESRHCVIGRTKSGGWALKDLGSRAGCRINGERVTSARLKPGDQLELGGLRLRFGYRDERPASPPAPKPKPPVKRLGGFRIEAKLGQGGMGEVLLAVQESLDRRVALKLLKQRLADDEDFVRRFQTEAKSAAALNHPHVVHVYDVGIVAGRHYLAMEYMEGGTLEDRMQKTGPLAAGEVHRILCETAAGLAFAEGRGIVHRDIKPENLMLDGSGTVKIADLGLAMSMEADEAGKQPILGTPHFMAPEQARGGKVDGRSDLYALGATAYRLLTGKTPFSGETTREILRAHFTQPPPHPAASVPDVPPELDALIVKLLAKEPADRYGSARELLAALEAIQPKPDADRTSKLPLLLGLLVAAGASAFFLLNPKQPPLPSPPVEDPEPLAVAPIDATPGTGLPAIPEVQEAPPEDNEELLQSLEKLSRSAYRGLDPITDPAARKLALEGLIEAFAGTSTATEAATEVQALDAVLAAQDAASASLAAEETRLASVIDSVITAHPKLSDGAPESPGPLVSALVELPPPGDASLAERFELRRKAAIREVFIAAEGHVEIEVAAAESFAVQGDFDNYQGRLQSLLPYFDVSALAPTQQPQPEDTEPTPSTDTPVASTPPQLADPRLDTGQLRELGLERFLAQRAEILTQIAQRPEREASFRAALAESDRSALATSLFAGQDGDRGLSAQLTAFAFTDAARGLEALEARLSTRAARAHIGHLIEETRAAQVALDTLIDAFPKGSWRRASVPLPKGGYATATGIDPAGLTIANASAPRTYTWSAYRGTPGLIDGLFKKRLRRDYTAAEQVGIASLARFAAVESAIARADRVLVKSSKERFSPKDTEAMVAAFEVAEQWSQASDSPAALQATERERSAVELLAKALAARVAGQDTLSAARFEELLRFHPGSLTVLLLSDGRGAAEPK